MFLILFIYFYVSIIAIVTIIASKDASSTSLSSLLHLRHHHLHHLLVSSLTLLCLAFIDAKCSRSCWGQHMVAHARWCPSSRWGQHVHDRWCPSSQWEPHMVAHARWCSCLRWGPHMVAHVYSCSILQWGLLMVNHSSTYSGFLFQLTPTPRFQKGGCKGEDNVMDMSRFEFVTSCVIIECYVLTNMSNIQSWYPYLSRLISRLSIPSSRSF